MLIELYDQAGDGIIIPASSDMTWTNQVGGIACFHPKMDGIFVPLGIVRHGKSDPIEDVCLFDPDEAKLEDCYDEMLVWQFLKSIGEHRQFRPLTDEEFGLNRRLLGEDFYLAEAWVPVFVLRNERPCRAALRQLAGHVGILTYPNSD